MTFSKKKSVGLTFKGNKDNWMFTLNCKGRLLVIYSPIVMGVININQDSFYQGSRHTGLKQILDTAEKMIGDGAAIIDIGGQSTRPGSIQISADEELVKVIPAIEMIRKNFPEIFISIDTYYGRVAKEAVNAGASMVNDISAGCMDGSMADTVATLQVPYILMHMQGQPADMQIKPHYIDVTQEVLDLLIQKVSMLKEKGIKDIIIDPGFGFGKTITHNFTLLKNLSVFKMLELPILLGVSRKSTIYKTLETNADNALNGTTVLNTIGLLNGAHILRVHDVKEAVETVKLFQAYQS